MNKIIIATLTLTALAASSAQAQKPESLEQARQLSIQQGKPLLLEFYHDD